MIIAHTPDADDAFMFYGLLTGKIATNLKITHIVEDIETLNRKAFQGEIDVTAISAHAYAFLHPKYRILSAGASIGDGYGPVVVARSGMDVKGKRIAVPGKYTTANLLLKLAVDDFQPVEMQFDEIIPAVQRGQVDAGLVIHEAQITYPQHGLEKVLDLWDWWHKKTELPLPLGINAIKRNVPEAAQREFLVALRDSVQYALDHVEEAMQYAMKYSRGADKELVTKFALMYVNKYTYEMTEEVVKAFDMLYRMAGRKGLFAKPPLDILFL
ncbi:1,4-dihydroxy-6-naphthoate synthase [Candidatus Methanophagaceae archaeon]|nr:1,4-dihydroxy-6-naphthoate synthase [Methanophagales archaeon]